jgi:3',5'-cyclic AMP phosphodiesterase CpdA
MECAGPAQRRRRFGLPSSHDCGRRLAGTFLFVAVVGLLFSGCAHSPSDRQQILARVALISDTHGNRSTNKDQALYRGRLDKAIAAVNESRADLVLIAGDLTQNGRPEELSDFQKQIEGFRAPVLFVPGNHDIGNKPIPGKEEGATSERLVSFEKKMGPSFFVRRLSGVRVIGFNSSILGSGLRREQEMWDVLEREMAKSTDRPTILLMHYPPFEKTADEPGGDYWNIEPGPRQRLLDLLRNGGVKTVLTGHLHRQLINRLDGILMVTTPPVSFGLPKGKQPEGWTLITIPRQGEAQVEFKTIAP